MSAGLSVLVSRHAGWQNDVLRALVGGAAASPAARHLLRVFRAGPGQTTTHNTPCGRRGHGKDMLRDLVRILAYAPRATDRRRGTRPQLLDLPVAPATWACPVATVHANSAREASTSSIRPLLAGENVTTGFVTPTLASSIDLARYGRSQPGRTAPLPRGAHKARAGRRLTRRLTSPTTVAAAARVPRPA